MINNALKSDIRKQAKALRTGIVGETRTQLQSKICQHIIGWPQFKKSTFIAIYIPDDSEVSLTALTTIENKQWFLPAIHPMHKRQLLFLPWAEETIFNKNKFGILEPEFNPLAAHPLLDIDIMFVPTVSFDESGWRLGRGAGFYDNTLAAIQHSTSIDKKPLIVGVAFESQQAKSIPHDEWDVKMDYIITEGGCFAAK